MFLIFILSYMSKHFEKLLKNINSNCFVCLTKQSKRQGQIMFLYFIVSFTVSTLLFIMIFFFLSTYCYVLLNSLFSFCIYSIMNKQEK